MKTQLRDLIASALYPTKAHRLPAICERVGLDPGTGDEAFSSKTAYVMKRVNRLSDEQVLKVAQRVVEEIQADELQAAVEKLIASHLLVTDLTRNHLAEALNRFPIEGKLDLLDLLRKHWPEIDRMPSNFEFGAFLPEDIQQHCIRNEDWSNSELLSSVGFLTCSQARLFGFLVDVVHPIRRDAKQQAGIVEVLNPILERDGYQLRANGKVSGYPTYAVVHVGISTSHPADHLISSALEAFDEEGVHAAWTKALERRKADPEGAITAARTLLETVCKHVIDEAGGSYGDKDDLPKLYMQAAEKLNLAPSQHSEQVFKAILGNCQQVVNSLGALRNRLGDAHGQGKMHVKPKPRHAELAVNLAGSMAMFLVSTWRECPKI